MLGPRGGRRGQRASYVPQVCSNDVHYEKAYLLRIHNQRHAIRHISLKACHRQAQQGYRIDTVALYRWRAALRGTRSLETLGDKKRGQRGRLSSIAYLPLSSRHDVCLPTSLPTIPHTTTKYSTRIQLLLDSDPRSHNRPRIGDSRKRWLRHGEVWRGMRQNMTTGRFGLTVGHVVSMMLSSVTLPTLLPLGIELQLRCRRKRGTNPV